MFYNLDVYIFGGVHQIRFIYIGDCILSWFLCTLIGILINMIKSLLIYIFFLPLMIILGQDTDEPTSETSVFSEYNVRSHLQFLGSDLFEGRGTGTRGGNLASKYIAFELSNMGVAPFGDNGTYYQNIPLHGSTPLPSSEMRIISDSGDTLLSMFEDYVMIKSLEKSYLPVASEMVFVGYGIVAPEYDHNDYQLVDVRDKIVVVLDGEPESDDPSYFEGKANSIYAIPESKIRIASARGAKGTVIIPNKNKPGFSWEKMVNQYSFEDVSLSYSANTNPAIFINPESAQVLFRNSILKDKDITNINFGKNAESTPLSVLLEFRGDAKQRDFIAANVVGIKDGYDDDYKDRYIILSAHYDHLGMAPRSKGDQVYNGVLDNAIGVAGLLEIIRFIVEYDIETRRSIIFMFLTGEEKGMLGSTYYTDHPLVPLYKTDANINIDGLAFIDVSHSAIGIGHKFSDIDIYLEEVLSEADFSLEKIPDNFSEWESFLRSDQLAFAKAGIPSVLIAEGTQYINLTRDEGIIQLVDYFQNIYHTPQDDLNQIINYEAAVNHLQIIYSLAYKLANTENDINWKSGSPFINARLRSIAEKK